MRIPRGVATAVGIPPRLVSAIANKCTIGEEGQNHQSPSVFLETLLLRNPSRYFEEHYFDGTVSFFSYLFTFTYLT